MPSCYEEFLHYFTPQQASVLRKLTPEISASHMGMSPFISKAGHIFLTTILVLFVASSATWEFIKFFTRPDIVKFSKQSAIELSPINIQLSVCCSNPPNCGDITVNQNFSAAATADFPNCRGLETKLTTIAAADTGKNSANNNLVTVPLCFTGEPIYDVNTNLPFQLPGITVEFSRINPGDPDDSYKAYGVVEVSSSASSTPSVPIRTVTMDLWQVKSLVLSQNLITKYGDLTERTVFAEATQYEGKRPSWRASLLIQSSRFVDAEITSQSTNMQAVWIVTGSCGLVFQFWLLCSVLTYPLRKIFPGEAQKAAEAFEKDGTIEGGGDDKKKTFTAADSSSISSPSSKNPDVISYKVME